LGGIITFLVICWLAIPFEFGAIRLVSVGNLEAAVSILLSTPPESSFFYVNALRAVALSSAVSRSLHELAVKVSLTWKCVCLDIKIQIMFSVQKNISCININMRYIY
jgi:hypothetical protein